MARADPFLDNAPPNGEDNGPTPADWALLVVRAVRRRKVIFTAVFVATWAAAFAFYRMRTPVYRVDAKVLAQRQQVLPSAFRGDSDENPARTAWDLIHRRDNLLALINTAGLVPVSPKPPGALTALLTRMGFLSPSSDPLDDMVDKLDRRLLVTSEEGTITVSFDWPDPKQAYAVVQGGMQNFIEARHVQEVTAVDEVISVLQVRTAKAKEHLERVTDEVRRERETVRSPREGGAQAPVAAAPSLRVAPATKAPNEELVRLKALIEGKRRAIEDVEEFRRRRLADLHAQLDEKRSTYSDAHPSIIQLRQDIDSLNKESSQVSVLRDEEAALRRQYQEKVGEVATAVAGESAVALPLPAPSAVRIPSPPVRERERPVEEDERVRDARAQYQQIVERVNAAQLELDAARAAFKYRYNVIWPAQIPRDPVSPDPRKILGIGLIGALLLAVVAAAAAELRSGRVVERWQVERGLGLPVLAEIGRHKR